VKYRYLIISEDFSVTGTNDGDIADEFSNYEIVIDCKTGKHLDSNKTVLKAEDPQGDEEDGETAA
jgi:hypothetical protein